MSYLLNRQYIVKEFTPARYIDGPYGIDINAAFKIVNNGTYFKLSGQNPTPIRSGNSTLRLIFCRGSCRRNLVDPNWVASGFSVVKFTTKIECYLYNSNPCRCRQESECEYNSGTQICMERQIVCSGTNHFGKSECRRKGRHIYYMDGGVLCNNLRKTGNCAVGKTVFGVNFGGNAHVDINQINYTKDDGNPPHTDKRLGITNERIVGIPGADKHLYTSFIYSKYIAGKGNCYKLEIPITEDGLYELSIKTGEMQHKEIKRSFNLWINYRLFLPEFFPALVRMPMNPFDINLNFKVSNTATTVELAGYPVLTLYSKILPIEFCPGTCAISGLDPNWIIGAVSVIKFN